MQVVFNPKDANTFASASLDKTIRVWNIASATSNYALVGHEKGVNCVDYYHGPDKPYLISGSDDFSVRVWDFQNKTCVANLDAHTSNVSCVAFHPELPIIITGSEDGSVKIWHSGTNKLEQSLNYGLERVWSIAYQRGSNDIALGFDEGSLVIKLGREEPAVSLDPFGKLVWARHNLVHSANLKGLADCVKDGEVVPVSPKDMGICEIFPQSLSHSPNGLFVVVIGDGEYIVYTALAWRNRSFGNGLDFALSQNKEF
jgi:coatomer subunit beta'